MIGSGLVELADILDDWAERTWSLAPLVAGRLAAAAALLSASAEFAGVDVHEQSEHALNERWILTKEGEECLRATQQG